LQQLRKPLKKLGTYATCVLAKAIHQHYASPIQSRETVPLICMVFVF